MENPVGRFLKRLKIELAYDPVIPLLGICLEENMIHYSLQHSLQLSQDMEPAYMSIDREMDKETT